MMKIYLICEKVEDSLTKRDTTLPKKKKSKKKRERRKSPWDKSFIPY